MLVEADKVAHGSSYVHVCVGRNVASQRNIKPSMKGFGQEPIEPSVKVCCMKHSLAEVSLDVTLFLGSAMPLPNQVGGLFSTRPG